MNILDKIVAKKREEVAAAKEQFSIKQLEQSNFFNRNTVSVSKNILQPNSAGIIAEFKKKSPSKGIINDTANVVEVVKGYANAGVSASSILTDTDFFGGSKHDLMLARNEVDIPLLRKDFMIDEYQLMEAKNWGADIVLLIAAILTPQQVKKFTDIAQNLGLEVLLELHGETELNHVYHKVNMVGINNRNLKNFEVDIEQSVRMAAKLGKDFIKVAESGISDIETLKHFKTNGFEAFLIGENFMKTDNPALACKNFIGQL
jgi:indole-3-glycerol phosphate synthase